MTVCNCTYFQVIYLYTVIVGKSSNFATVPARLIVDGKDHGIQMFIVQLRDLQTHQPLPGIIIKSIRSLI